MTNWPAKRLYILELCAVIVAVWIVSIMAFHTNAIIQDSREAKDREILEARPFTDFMRYNAILPEAPIVPHGSPARFISDTEVLEIPKNGLRVDWNEHIECDYNPYDDEPHFDFYQEVQPSGRKYSNVVKKKTQWTAYLRRHYDYDSDPKPIKYPSTDTDCRLYSFMVMEIAGTLKTYWRFSENVKVRGQND